MNKSIKIVLYLIMLLALLFGFLNNIYPDFPFKFQRLHIFLFNLCCGGSIILYYTNQFIFSNKLYLYLLLSICYALTAFFELYVLTLLISIPLFYIVESERIKHFSFFPKDFFNKTTIYKKFNHASVLCLSIAILFASIAILNENYFQSYSIKNLTIEMFFLGYSFPLSLIALSVIFHFISSPLKHERKVNNHNLYIELFFWFLNLGVIFFFIFILLEKISFQIVFTTILLITIIFLFFFSYKRIKINNQRNVLLSGLLFLVCTGITGEIYILQYFYPEISGLKNYFLTFHSTVALYGWNLSGLFIILRWQDFPDKLNINFMVIGHWIAISLLAVLGKYFISFSFPALVAFAMFIGIIFFYKTKPLGD